jgi:hypothetical protein
MVLLSRHWRRSQIGFIPLPAFVPPSRKQSMPRFALALMIVALAGGNALAEDAINPPNIKPGDRWVYDGGEGKRTIRVDSVEANGDILANIQTPSLGGLQITFTKEWNPLMQPQAIAGRILYLRYDPAVCAMPPAPWTVGKEWSCEPKYSAGGTTNNFLVKGKIEAREKITVPAGSFDTLRVRENVGGAETILWYAPAAAQFVKIDAGAGSPFSMELVSYELK